MAAGGKIVRRSGAAARVVGCAAAWLVPSIVGCSATEAPVRERVALPALSPCGRLYAALERHDRLCGPSFAQLANEPSFVASCEGIVAAKGVNVTEADLDRCAATLATCEGSPVGCTAGGGQGLLFPRHDVVGTKTPGEACFTDVQCDSGYCRITAGTCGRCDAARREGESCGRPVDRCVDGSNCTGGYCRFRGKREREACFVFGGIGECAPGLECKPVRAANGVCLRLPVEGEPCTSDRRCRDGLRCIGPVCRAPLRDGEPCSSVDRGCGETLFSECVAGRCRSPDRGRGEGEACRSIECRTDLICRSGTCRALAPLGESCDGEQCSAAGICVDDVCEPRPRDGDPCYSGVCASGNVCVGFRGRSAPGTCRRLGGVDDECPCDPALVCKNGKCAALGDALCR